MTLPQQTPGLKKVYYRMPRSSKYAVSMRVAQFKAMELDANNERYVAALVEWASTLDPAQLAADLLPILERLRPFYEEAGEGEDDDAPSRKVVGEDPPPAPRRKRQR